MQIQSREPFSPTRIFTLKSQSRAAKGRTGQKISRLPCHDWKIRIKRPGFYCLARSSVVSWSKRSLSCFFARSFSTASVLGTVSDSVTWSLATTSSSISSRQIRERPITSRPSTNNKVPIASAPTGEAPTASAPTPRGRRPPPSKNDRKGKLGRLYTNGKLVGRILWSPGLSL